MYYTVYKTTNLVNGKIYIGMHKTSFLYDSYLGSGTHLRKAIKKYGYESFQKEIIAIFDNENDMFELEKKLVSKEFIDNKNTYNIVLGGPSFSGLNDNVTFKNPTHTPEHIQMMALRHKEKMNNDEEYKTSFLRKLALNYKYRDEGSRKFIREQPEKQRAIGNLGRLKAQSQSARQKRIERFKEIRHQQGEKNSMFGTIWITDGNNSRRIKQVDEIPIGWFPGRVMGSRQKSLKIATRRSSYLSNLPWDDRDHQDH